MPLICLVCMSEKISLHFLYTRLKLASFRTSSSKKATEWEILKKIEAGNVVEL